MRNYSCLDGMTGTTKKTNMLMVLTLCTAIKKVMEMMGGLKQPVCKSTNVWVKYVRAPFLFSGLSLVITIKFLSASSSVFYLLPLSFLSEKSRGLPSSETHFESVLKK